MRSEIAAEPLVLRQYEPAFAALLYEAARASYSPQFAHYLPWCHAAYTLAESEQFVAQSAADWQDGSAYNYALFDAQSREFCGGIGLNQPNQVHGYYNLGYWVRTSRQRQGLAAQAIHHLVRAAFADLPTLHRLEILTLPDNLPSQRTALAAGATPEGLLRQRLRVGPGQYDALLYSLVRADVA
ncbi:MAG: GNAT family N-acetyltransferase [Janthinobacterium lividum]